MRDELGGQALVEGDGGGFRGGVVDQAGGADVAGHGGDGDDHAVVRAHHGGEELPRQVVVGECVDAEGQVEVALGGVEDSFAACDARVVDEDCGVAQGGADLAGGGFDGGGGGEVAVEEVDV